jgi:hypothetical protein
VTLEYAVSPLGSAFRHPATIAGSIRQPCARCHARSRHNRTTGTWPQIVVRDRSAGPACRILSVLGDVWNGRWSSSDMHNYASICACWPGVRSRALRAQMKTYVVVHASGTSRSPDQRQGVRPRAARAAICSIRTVVPRSPVPFAELENPACVEAAGTAVLLSIG